MGIVPNVELALHLTDEGRAIVPIGLAKAFAYFKVASFSEGGDRHWVRTEVKCD